MSSSDENLRFGRYQILRRPTDGKPWELGRGGMGATFKAEDPELQRIVVLKIILPTLLGQDPLARARFRREACAAAGVHHPHIATVFDIGEARGTDYYVMEYVAGENLLCRLQREGRLDLPTTLRLGWQVADALQAAWEPHRIIHRDLKPSNLMLVGQDGGQIVVKVVDFGLAKALKAVRYHESTAMSATGRPVFTPLYASPEQIDGELGEVDIRSDLYSLGVTMWHCLLGRPTFHFTSYERIIVGHLTLPPPISELQAAGVPGAVANLLCRLLAKNPAQRPAGPAAVRDELDWLLGTTNSARLLPPPPVPNRPGSMPGSPRAAARTRRKLPGRPIVIALVGCAVLAVAGLRSPHPAVQPVTVSASVSGSTSQPKPLAESPAADDGLGFVPDGKNTPPPRSSTSNQPAAVNKYDLSEYGAVPVTPSTSGQSPESVPDQPRYWVYQDNRFRYYITLPSDLFPAFEPRGSDLNYTRGQSPDGRTRILVKGLTDSAKSLRQLYAEWTAEHTAKDPGKVVDSKFFGNDGFTVGGHDGTGFYIVKVIQRSRVTLFLCVEGDLSSYQSLEDRLYHTFRSFQFR